MSLEKRVERLRQKLTATGIGPDPDGAALMEEKRSSFARLRTEYLDQLWRIRAPRFHPAKRPEDRTLPSEASELWGEDASFARERIHELALERSIEAERQRGTPEDVIDEVLEAFELWRAKVDESYGHSP